MSATTRQETKFTNILTTIFQDFRNFYTLCFREFVKQKHQIYLKNAKLLSAVKIMTYYNFSVAILEIKFCENCLRIRPHWDRVYKAILGKS